MQARGFLQRSAALLGCLAVALTIQAPAGATPPEPGAEAAAAAVPASVTLITGDTVTVTDPPDAPPAVSVRRAEGTRGVATLRRGEDVYVVPDQVDHLVPDVLDLELFNVTGLVAMGYADASTDTLPVIVRGAQPFARAAGTRALPSIGATAVTLPKGAWPGARTLAAGTSRVWLDRRYELSDLDWNLAAIGAPDVWESGLSGAGVDVAVLDSGVDPEHPDLADALGAQADFTGSGSPADENGHGTHVASIIAGSGAGADGARRGVAHGARLLSGRVLDAEGAGQASWVIAGMEWAAEQGADVVNLSLGARATEGDDPVAMALDALSERTGTLFVVAAGNSGPGMATVESPGTAASALTVGATDPDGRVARFSSWGPTTGAYLAKPDLSAPGSNITGARLGGGYTQLSGTSQATPHVAGAAALLREQHPDWDAQRIKTALMSSADAQWGDERPATNMEGAGLLDLPGATGETLVPGRPSVDLGYLRYPDGRGQRTVEVSLTNTGDTAETVTATDLAYDHWDTRAPDDLVTITPAELTVVPGATETLTVTVTPENADAGVYVGAISLARDGRDTMTLPLNFYAEAARADLRLTVLNRRGEPDAGGTVWLANMAEMHPRTGGGFDIVQLDENGQGTGRMVPGPISVVTTIETPAAGDAPATVTLAGDPEVMLTEDMDHTVDARRAKVLEPATVTGKRTRTSQAAVFYSHEDVLEEGSIGEQFPVSREEVEQGRVFLQPTGPVRHGRTSYDTQWQLDGTGRDAGELFQLYLGGPTVPNPPAYRASKRDLARLDSDYRTAGPGEQSFVESWEPMVGLRGGFIFGRPLTTPARRTEWVTARPDLTWRHCLAGPGQAARICTPATSYRAGSRHRPVWFRTLTPAMFQGSHDRTRMNLIVGVTDGTHNGHPHDPAVMGDWSLRLFRNGVEQNSLGPRSFWFDIDSPERAVYRLEHRATPSRDLLRLGSRVETTWTFPSAAPTDPAQWATAPKLLALDYRPPTDAEGRLRAWRPLVMDVRLTSSTGPTEPIATERGTLRLWTSTDHGRRWHRAIVVPRHDGTFLVVAPIAPRPGQTVSVRAEGRATEGRTINQTIVDAYSVR